MGKHPRWTSVRKFVCWSCGTVTRPLVVKFKRAVHARKRGPVTALDWIAPLTLGCMPRTFSRGWNLSSPVSFCSYFWWIHRYCRWSHKPTYNWGKLGAPSRRILGSSTLARRDTSPSQWSNRDFPWTKPDQSSMTNRLFGFDKWNIVRPGF